MGKINLANKHEQLILAAQQQAAAKRMAMEAKKKFTMDVAARIFAAHCDVFRNCTEMAERALVQAEVFVSACDKWLTGETKDAQAVRSDAGSVHQGRDEREGSQSQGCQDLQRQASDAASDRKTQGEERKKEVIWRGSDDDICDKKD